MSVKKQPALQFFKAETGESLELPFMDIGISAGFPSPAMDFMESRLDVTKMLIKNPLDTFFAKVSGNSMTGAGINDGDLLVIDRKPEPEDRNIAVCFVNGEFTVKRLSLKEGKLFLLPENPDYPAIPVSEESQFVVWGIVTYVIKRI